MTIKHLTFDDSTFISGTSLTANYQTLLSMSDDADFFFLYNTTDATILVSVPNGANSTKELRFPPSSSMVIDCRTNSKRIAKGVIQVKYVAAASTGEVIMTVAR